MAADIVIEKRTRALVTDVWGAWGATTDAPPYTNSDVVEYRAAGLYQSNSSIDITVQDLTDGSILQDALGEYYWQGTGVFDKIMESVNSNIKVEFDNGRIVGQAYAATYLGGLQSALTVAAQFVTTVDSAKANADAARINAISKEFTLEQMMPISKDKADEELQVMLDTHTSKVAISEYQADKVSKDVDMTVAQIKALEEQVIDNRYIKAIDSLSSVYGTFGAGGINVSSDQWGVYYKLISEMIEDLRDYKGVWNATGAFPGPVDGVIGDFYVVSVAGSTSLDGIATWAANDIVFYDGAKWKKLAASPSTAEIGRV